jgi:hypothetical protein
MYIENRKIYFSHFFGVDETGDFVVKSICDNITDEKL